MRVDKSMEGMDAGYGVRWGQMRDGVNRGVVKERVT